MIGLTTAMMARWSMFGELGDFAPSLSPESSLVVYPSSGPNLGNLSAKIYVPASLRQGASLVVVLHGCDQTAEDCDLGTGWSEMADRHGFVVLFPEQRRSNNLHRCFNWFDPRNMQRGLGEPASIKQMIDQVVEDHKIDSDQIFITGLSAGGAMAGVMLATYPEMFAGGGLIAAMPFGVARTSYSALQRMRVGGGELGPELAELVRGASPHKGPWPRISIWHGTSDKTVDISNAEASLAQWLGVHEISNSSVITDLVDGFPHRVWHNAEGTAVIEEYSVTNMGHGTPLNLADTDACGQSGPYSLEVGISSTQHLGTFWGLDRR